MKYNIKMLGWIALLWCGLPGTMQAQTFLGKSVQTWAADLDRGSDTARRSAAFALGKIGSSAGAALPQLKKHLREDQDERVREASAFALGEIARSSIRLSQDASLVNVLREALTKDQNPLVRRSAAYALGNLGSDGAAGLPSLEAALNDPSVLVRQNAAWALGKLGAANAVPALQKALHDQDPLVKRDAAASLGAMDPTLIRPILPDLFDLCRENQSEVRRAVLGVLIKVVGPDDVVGAGAVQEALQDADEEVRDFAALTLSNIGGPAAAVAIPHLLKALRGEAVDLRRQAAAGIRNIGPAAVKAVPELTRALGDADEEVRGNAAMALGGIGEAAAQAYPSLVKLLEDSHERPETRIEAAVALSRMGDVPAATEAVPRLLKVLSDATQEDKVRERIVWALRVHNARLRQFPDVFPSFTKVLNEPKKNKNRMLRYDCAFMLGMLQGAKVEDIVMNTLHEFLKDDSIQIYVNKKANVGGASQEGNSGRVESKEIGKGDGRIMAVRALHQIGPDRVSRHRDIIAELRLLANNPNIYADLRVGARELLKDIAAAERN